MKIALVGATGLLGQEVIQQVEANSDLADLEWLLLASEKSVGEKVSIHGQDFAIEKPSEGCYQNCDLVILCCPPHEAVNEGSIALMQEKKVLDFSRSLLNSSGLEANEVFHGLPEQLHVAGRTASVSIEKFEKALLYSVPHPVTGLLYLIFKSFLNKGIKINKSVWQGSLPVSFWGKKGLEELSEQSINVFNHKDLAPGIFPAQMAFNVLPFAGPVPTSFESEEELGIQNELLRLYAGVMAFKTGGFLQTVPTFYGMSVHMHLALSQSVSLTEIEQIFTSQQGFQCTKSFATPIEVLGSSEIWLGRIQKNNLFEQGLSLVATADHLKRLSSWQAVALIRFLLRRQASAE